MNLYIIAYEGTLFVPLAIYVDTLVSELIY